MGNYNINIQGIGCHHNEDSKTDAQYLAARLVDELKKNGHIIEAASFTSGGKEDLLIENGHWTKKRE